MGDAGGELAHSRQTLLLLAALFDQFLLRHVADDEDPPFSFLTALDRACERLKTARFQFQLVPQPARQRGQQCCQRAICQMGEYAAHVDVGQCTQVSLSQAVRRQHVPFLVKQHHALRHGVHHLLNLTRLRLHANEQPPGFLFSFAPFFQPSPGQRQCVVEVAQGDIGCDDDQKQAETEIDPAGDRGHGEQLRQRITQWATQHHPQSCQAAGYSDDDHRA